MIWAGWEGDREKCHPGPGEVGPRPKTAAKDRRPASRTSHAIFKRPRNKGRDLEEGTWGPEATVRTPASNTEIK